MRRLYPLAHTLLVALIVLPNLSAMWIRNAQGKWVEVPDPPPAAQSEYGVVNMYPNGPYGALPGPARAGNNNNYEADHIPQGGPAAPPHPPGYAPARAATAAARRQPGAYAPGPLQAPPGQVQPQQYGSVPQPPASNAIFANRSEVPGLQYGSTALTTHARNFGAASGITDNNEEQPAPRRTEVAGAKRESRQLQRTVASRDLLGTSSNSNASTSTSTAFAKEQHGPREVANAPPARRVTAAAATASSASAAAKRPAPVAITKKEAERLEEEERQAAAERAEEARKAAEARLARQRKAEQEKQAGQPKNDQKKPEPKKGT